jgi:uncharacterized glyoxalase superfamily protein PhnB
MESTQNILETVPFLSVSNIERSLDFYVKGLGFEIQNAWTPEGKIEWCKLKRQTGSLMLQEHKKMNEGSIQDKGRVGIGMSIYFICEDAISIYRELLGNGIHASEPFVSNRMWLTTIEDPDGYVINFESSTNVPEETILSEWDSSQG